ncbi:MAG: 2-amino-4-hydroxy-6-hydroxymethyldihydropteridine diphosphokinase [Muribaculaceae bacterium]|nr:2-amino-4-hydroxy-6-hydroxymethyldihydropteridine diphosphokinase [Muribaculaceae bacterium]
MKYYLNIGTNLGNRLMNLSKAVSAIEKEFGWFELSHHIESEPWGFSSKNKFLNIGMLIISDQEPLQVLRVLQAIERSISPNAHRNPDGSYRDRLIDIDIMAAQPEDTEAETYPEFGIELNTPELTLPHPHLQDRPFFLDAYRELRNLNQN